MKRSKSDGCQTATAQHFGFYDECGDDQVYSRGRIQHPKMEAQSPKDDAGMKFDYLGAD
jgi:hypothetical protein